MLYIVAIILLSVGCKQYSADPYDEEEKKYRDLWPASQLKKAILQGEWDKRDSLTYLRFSNLEELYLITDSIPGWVTRFKKLKTLYRFSTEGEGVSWIPGNIGDLENLEQLVLDKGRIKYIPASVTRLKKLVVLQLSNNDITDIPKDIGELKNLEMIALDGNRISELPESIYNLAQLTYLNLSENNISEIPEGICNLKKLEYLSISENNISHLPECIDGLSQLETLFLDDNPIAELPEGLFKQSNRLKDIYIGNLPLKDEERTKERIKELKQKNWQKRKEQYLKEQEELKNKK